MQCSLNFFMEALIHCNKSSVGINRAHSYCNSSPSNQQLDDCCIFNNVFSLSLPKSIKKPKSNVRPKGYSVFVCLATIPAAPEPAHYTFVSLITGSQFNIFHQENRPNDTVTQTASSKAQHWCQTKF